MARVAGGEDGCVRVFDLSDGAPVCEFAVAEDTVNGVHFHPVLPLLATASGARCNALGTRMHVAATVGKA